MAYTQFKQGQIKRYQTTMPSSAPGFGTPEAQVQTLQPSDSATVSVQAQGPDTAKVFSFQFGIPGGVPGDDGIPGASAGFGTPVASVDVLDVSDSATVSVTASGQDTAKIFNFQFGIPRSPSGIRLCQTVSDPQGNTITVQPVTLDASGNATAQGGTLTVPYTWNLIGGA